MPRPICLRLFEDIERPMIRHAEDSTIGSLDADSQRISWTVAIIAIPATNTRTTTDTIERVQRNRHGRRGISPSCGRVSQNHRVSPCVKATAATRAAPPTANAVGSTVIFGSLRTTKKIQPRTRYKGISRKNTKPVKRQNTTNNPSDKHPQP